MVGVAARSGHHYRLDPQCLDTQSTVRGIGTQPFTFDAARAAVTFGGERGRIVPLDAYRGVSVRMERLPEPGHVRVWLELLHTDSRLTVPLMAADDSDAVVADWQEWGRLLKLPLLVVAADGTVSAPLTTLGALLVFPPKMRRRSLHFTRRRPRFLVRRKPGRSTGHTRVAGREIIARD
jgi:hypothetical protein